MDGKNIKFNKSKYIARKRFWEKIRAKKIPRTLESIALKLQKENRSNEEFEIMINNISIEELIQLKLEISTRMVMRNKFYNFPLWNLVQNMAKEAVLKFALSSAMTRKEVASVLGISISTLTAIITKMKPFEEENKEDF